MIDQSVLNLSPVQQSPRASKQGKAGTSTEDGAQTKSFDDVVAEAADKDTGKAKLARITTDDEKLSAKAGDEPAAATTETTAPQGRIKLSAGLHHFIKAGKTSDDAPMAETPAKDPKAATLSKLAKAADAQVKSEDETPAVSASEELSMLLGLEPESEATDDVVAEKPTAKTAKVAAGEEDIVDVKADDAANATVQPAKETTTSQVPTHHTAAIAVDAKTASTTEENSGASAAIRLVSGDEKEAAVDVPKVTTDAAEAKDKTASSKTDFVTVLESRRYLGFSNDSNAGTLAAAIKADPSWAQAVHASMSGVASGQSHATLTQVNTLKLEMNPGHLGHMTASLRLKGEELSVEVRVDTVEAYRQLSSDHDGLVKALRDQGFTIDQVTVQLSPSAKSDTNMNGGSQSDNGQNLREGKGEAGRERNDSSRRSNNQNEWTDNERTSTVGDTGGSDDSSARNIYL